MRGIAQGARFASRLFVAAFRRSGADADDQPAHAWRGLRPETGFRLVAPLLTSRVQSQGQLGIRSEWVAYGHCTRAPRLSSILSEESCLYGTVDSDAEGRARLCVLWVREAGYRQQRRGQWCGPTTPGQSASQRRPRHRSGRSWKPALDGIGILSVF